LKRKAAQIALEAAESATPKSKAKLVARAMDLRTIFLGSVVRL